MRHSRYLISLIVAASALAATPQPADAGSYSVSGLCGLWSSFTNNSARVAVYPEAGCYALTARNSVGNYRSARGTQGGWSLPAPAGSRITSLNMHAYLFAADGWDAVLLADGAVIAGCPGNTRCEGSHSAEPNFATDANAAQILARVRCYASSCPNTGPALHDLLQIYSSSVTITDYSAPAVAITGGSAVSGGWKSGTKTLTVDATDNVGVRQYETYADGASIGVAPRGDCSYVSRLVPCPNGASTMNITLRELADGRHSLRGRATDSAGNPGSSGARVIAVDNHPPVSPQNATVDGGAGWRTAQSRTVRWTNPPEKFAPIARARYELCPAAVDSANKITSANARKRCVARAVTGSRITAIKVPLPGEGAWQVQRLWLEDSPGNHNAAAGVNVVGLGYDATPPTGVAFASEDPADPARLNLRANDSISGITGGAIEVRRIGDTLWRPLTTTVSASGLTATLDDEHLRRGVYDLRGVAINGAGLQHGTDRRQDGLPARIKLPVRAASRLVAGRFSGRRCHRHRPRRCRARLDRRPSVGIGRSSLLRGQLTIRGRAVKRRVALQVFSRRLGTKSSRSLRSIRTTKGGRFRYRARRGPARTNRFSYAGTPLIRGANAPVKLRVAASTNLRAPRHSVVNGEYATFRGKLRGGWVPAAGVLVELQVYARGSWRTFAQPRTDGSGRWRYQYRFETISGNARFRFRARIRRQSGYPFATGTSRAVHVRVRGL